MPVVKREFKRKSGFRDAKLIVIATEGVQTEHVYFEGVRQKYQRPNLHIELLKRTDAGHSSPKHVITELNVFKKEYHLVKGDELWMVIDKDRWLDEHLSEVTQECSQKNYYCAVSVPCFEIWILLHLLTTIDNGSLVGLNCERIIIRILELLGC
jgi:RloB-like protein